MSVDATTRFVLGPTKRVCVIASTHTLIRMMVPQGGVLATVNIRTRADAEDDETAGCTCPWQIVDNNFERVLSQA